MTSKAPVVIAVEGVSDRIVLELLARPRGGAHPRARCRGRPSGGRRGGRFAVLPEVPATARATRAGARCAAGPVAPVQLKSVYPLPAALGAGARPRSRPAATRRGTWDCPRRDIGRGVILPAQR